MTKKGNTICPNCENEFDQNYNYCPYCGQENKEPDLKLKHFFSEFFSANFNLDSKILQTLKLLIFHPGKLSLAILEGKHASYISPVRLYLLISLIYFFIISLTPDNDFVTIQNNNQSEITEGAITVDKPADTLKLSDTEKTILAKIDAIKTQEGKRTFWQKFRKSMSIGMFFFIPLTAWFFFLLFRKKYRYFIPHLIFTIHFQTLVFLIFTVFTTIHFFIRTDYLIIIEILLIICLLYTWIRSFYHTKPLKTIYKMLIFLIIWSGTLVIYLMFLLLISVYLT